MKNNSLEWGNLLAEEVIKKHKEIFVLQPQPNYYLCPLKYIPSDTWVTTQWWVDLGVRLVNDEIDVLTGLEILLNAGKEEYLEKANVFIEELWSDKNLGIYDEEYFYNIIVQFHKGNKIRDYYVNSEKMNSIDRNELLRKALIRMGDEKACSYVSMKIANKIEKNIDLFDEVEEYIMPRLAEFGSFWPKYFTNDQIDILKKKCVELLDKDKYVVENKMEQELLAKEERSLWIKDRIAYWSWVLGWSDIIVLLKSSPWYWDNLKDLFSDDVDNENFLVWSNYSKDVTMQDKSIDMMENYLIDGAIAWTRMRRI